MTLRFESKHGYFKNCVRHCPNFKNLLYSLTKKHQLLQALNNSQDQMFDEKVTAKEAVLFISEHYPATFTECISGNCSFGKENIKYVSKEICYRGIIYGENKFICSKKKMKIIHLPSVKLNLLF